MENVVREEELTSSAPKKKKKLTKKRVLAVILVVALAAGVVAWKKVTARPEAAAVVYQEAAAEKRDIVNSLSGSGTLQPADSYTVTTLVSGEILSDTFEEGDIVEKDALLYTLDSSDASTSQSQAQRSYNQAVQSKYPTADLSGTVSEVYVANGDSVSSGTKLM